MAQDRLFHKRLGHSEKVNALTDFEYIVWGCYVMTADDFGVMRFSPVTLQADHDRLMARPTKVVEAALERCVTAALIVDFDHQMRRYVCQLDWQDFQKIRFPSKTHNPIPPVSILDRCTKATRDLFGKRTEVFPSQRENGLHETARSIGVLPHESANGNGNANAIEPDRARARALGKERRLEPLPPLPSDEISDRAGRLLERYSVLFVEHRRGAQYRSKPALDFPLALDLVRIWPDDRLEKLAALVLTTDEKWISSTDRSFTIFAQKASWADDRLCAWEISKGVSA